MTQKIFGVSPDLMCRNGKATVYFDRLQLTTGKPSSFVKEKLPVESGKTVIADGEIMLSIKDGWLFCLLPPVMVRRSGNAVSEVLFVARPAVERADANRCSSSSTL